MLWAYRERRRGTAPQISLVQHKQSRAGSWGLQRAHSLVLLVQRLGEKILPHWQGDNCIHLQHLREPTHLMFCFEKNYRGLFCMQKELSLFWFFFSPASEPQITEIILI